MACPAGMKHVLCLFRRVLMAKQITRERVLVLRVAFHLGRVHDFLIGFCYKSWIDLSLCVNMNME